MSKHPCCLQLEESARQLEEQREELRLANVALSDQSEALGERNREIERKNDEVEASRIQLEVKAHELEAASRYKSEFLANMSHELRTPLNSLMILSESLSKNKQGNLTEDQVKCADIIHGAGGDLLSLINDILDLSKVEAGKLEVSAEEIRISRVADAIRQQFDPLAQKKDLPWSVEVADDAPGMIVTDLQRLEQILRNLLSNAFKFTDTGSIRLCIDTPDQPVSIGESVFGAGDAVTFSVIDTGSGIPEEKQDKIFRAFEQADGSISRSHGGTGLGLTISRKLAHLLGGEIALQSEEGKGTTFTLYLPFESPMGDEAESETGDALPAFQPLGDAMPELVGTRDTTTDAIPTETSVSSGCDPAAAGGTDSGANEPPMKKILIIEDEPGVSSLLRAICEARGYSCIAEICGRNGILAASEQAPDAILLDLGLPDIDGPSVLECLKDSLNTRHIPIYVISGMRNQIEFLSRGALGFLPKPVTSERVNAVLDEIENVLQVDRKSILIVEDNEGARAAIRDALGDINAEIFEVASAEEAHEKLKTETFACMIVDLNLNVGSLSGYDLLKRVSCDEAISDKPPTVIYTGKELGSEEYKELRKWSNSIVVKGADTPQRLVDEVALFLHCPESRMPEDQRRMIKELHEDNGIIRGRRILVVDDDLRNIFSLSTILEEIGAEVVTADSGQAALDQLADDRGIDLVLMDIMMPGMDGFEAIRRIRAQVEFGDLPIIAVTAKAMPEDRGLCLQSGADHYLTKPVDTEKLMAALRLWLYRKAETAV